MVKFIPEKLYEYMQSVKSTLKQVDIEPGYTILDSKSEDHYFKYKDQATLNDEQVKDFKKSAKYQEKPLQAKDIIDDTGKHFDPEVIENKAG